MLFISFNHEKIFQTIQTIIGKCKQFKYSYKRFILMIRLKYSYILFVHFFKINTKFKNSYFYKLVLIAMLWLLATTALLLFSVVRSPYFDEVSFVSCYIIMILSISLFILVRVLVMISTTLTSPTKCIYRSIVYLSNVHMSARSYARWNTIFLSLNSKNTFNFSFGPIKRLTSETYCTFFFIISMQFLYVLKHSRKNSINSFWTE